jgi:hypothetical protein
MFRGIQKSKMQPDQFGVGSIFEADRSNRYVVVSEGPCVRILNLNTFEVSTNWVSVEDVNFLTQDEARKVVNLADLNFTFSDFDFNPSGIKPA